MSDNKKETNSPETNPSEASSSGHAENLKELEQASLSTLILSLSSSALIHMGLEPKMKDKKDLRIAQFNIDMLEVLQEKTSQHRSEQESQLLEHCIKDLKLNFIKVK